MRRRKWYTDRQCETESVVGMNFDIFAGREADVRKEAIHKFEQGGRHILLDVNSGAVHLLDRMTYDLLDVFDGTNDEETARAFSGKYPETEIRGALSELHELMDAGQLFAPEIPVPPTFAAEGVVKSLCLMIAHDCNLRCGYCFAGTGEIGGKRELMSREVGEAAVEYIIDHSKERRHCEIDFFGGEPLVNLPAVKHVT